MYRRVNRTIEVYYLFIASSDVLYVKNIKKSKVWRVYRYNFKKYS